MQPSPDKQKPGTKHAPPVTTADIVGILSGFAASAGMANGLWPSAMLAPGPLAKVLPIILIVTVGTSIGCGWRMIFHHVARDQSPARCALWASLGAALWIAGVCTSGWFMAAYVGGGAAVRDHEYAHLSEMDKAVHESADRAKSERQLLQIASAEERNLRSTQDSERRFGTISKKAGDKGVTDAIGREADAFNSLAAILKAHDARRQDLLKQADEEMSRARDMAALGDRNGFVTAVTQAASSLKQANAISLLDDVGGFGAGMSIDQAREPFDQAKREVDQFVSGARDKQADVVVPVFRPMSDLEAVVNYPPALAWVFAIMLESFPMFMTVGLVLSNHGGHRPMFSPVME